MPSLLARLSTFSGLNDDKTDPDGWTSFMYSVRVKKIISGHTSTNILLNASNDSGGYRMSAGESHLLILVAARHLLYRRQLRQLKGLAKRSHRR